VSRRGFEPRLSTRKEKEKDLIAFLLPIIFGPFKSAAVKNLRTRGIMLDFDTVFLVMRNCAEARPFDLPFRPVLFLYREHQY
jgi:hypothetical protein